MPVGWLPRLLPQPLCSVFGSCVVERSVGVKLVLIFAVLQFCLQQILDILKSLVVKFRVGGILIGVGYADFLNLRSCEVSEGLARKEAVEISAQLLLVGIEAGYMLCVGVSYEAVFIGIAKTDYVEMFLRSFHNLIFEFKC